MKKGFFLIAVLLAFYGNAGNTLAQSEAPKKFATVEDFRKLRTAEEKMKFIDIFENLDRKTFEGIYPFLDKKNDLRPLLLWHYKKSSIAEYYGYTSAEAKASMHITRELAEQNGYTAEALAAEVHLAVVDFTNKKLSEQQLYSFYLKNLAKMRAIGIGKFDYFAADWILFQMGRTFYTLGDYEKALESLILSHQYTNAPGNPYHTLVLNMIQTIYANQKDYPKAIAFAQKIYDNSYKLNPTQDPKMWRPLFWQGLSSLDMASYYMELNDLEKAELYAQKGYKLTKLEYDYKDPASHTLTVAEFDALQVVIKLALKRGELDEVQKHLNRVEEIRPYIRFDDQGNYFKALPLYHNYIQFFEKTRQLSSAYTYLKLSKVMEDSLAKQNDKRKLWQIEMRVDAERYQTQIAVAEKNEQQQILFRNLAILAFLAVSIGAYIVYRRIKSDNETIAKQKVLLESSLTEKETLLQEIHHRVKNNLQIIAGLFEKQARNTTDEKAQKLMREGQDRVYSIALVHQNLYQSENLSTIEIKSFTETLIKNIEKSQKSDKHSIRTFLDTDESSLTIDHAIPLGLILNELITNCYKYAFDDRDSGEIHVSFHQQKSQYQLRIRDNGVGIPQNTDIYSRKKLGLNLVRGLVRQLDGKMDIQSNETGTQISVSFT